MTPELKALQALLRRYIRIGQPLKASALQVAIQAVKRVQK